MSAVLALLASLVWGTSDYFGGSVTRRLPVIAVIAAGQAAALVVLVVVVTAAGQWRWDDAVGWGALCGAVGAGALAAFYTALSSGTMGVVAPVASCGVLVPVLGGLVQGERPGPVQVVGIVATVAGVVIAGHSAGPGAAPGASQRSIALALIAALGFGVVLLGVGAGARSSTGTTLAIQRLVSVCIVVAVLLGGRPRRNGRRAAVPPAPSDRPPAPGSRSDWGLAVGSGLGDAGANALYAAAVTGGLVSVNAVLSSLYPVVTAVMARRLDKELLTRLQLVGVATALGGVVLLAAG